MRINNNIMAMNAHRQLAVNQGNAAKSMERLSSGFRVNRAGDDAAGLSISEKMRGQIRGLKQASRNAQDAISLIQTAEGALNETHAILQRMRELAVQASNDTNVEVDRQALDDEFQALIDEIDRIADETQFNEQDIIKDDFAASIQVGANYGQIISLKWNQQKKTALGENKIDVSELDIKTFAKAQTAVSTVNAAINSVSASRSKMGALQNRLEHTISNLNNAAENLQAAESRVRDLDMAEEIMAFTKNSILQQAATAMLAQANMAPQSVLQLLG